MTTTDREKAIKAWEAIKAHGTIVIHADDLTPKGKRSFKIVSASRGGIRLRLYVAGRRYRSLAATVENLNMAKEWVA